MYKMCGNCESRIYVKPCRYRPFNYCSAKCQMKHQYANGRPTDTEAANRTVRANGFPQKKGKKIPHLHNEEAYKKNSLSKIGKKNPMYGKTGASHPRWTGGKTMTLWKSVEYQRWRKAVYKRDNYTCVECGDSRGGNLEADHIKPRYHFPELTFDLSNGRTLCHDCHVKTPTYGDKVKRIVYA